MKHVHNYISEKNQAAERVYVTICVKERGYRNAIIYTYVDCL